MAWELAARARRRALLALIAIATALAALPADAQVKAVVTGVANVDVVSTNVYRNEANGTWRLALRFKQRKADEPVELRAFLQHGNDILSETWTHVIPPR